MFGNVSVRKFGAQAILNCLTFALLSVAVPAANYDFDIWTTANGLPQNTVTGVAQTKDGYLWLSTFDGLARFDGVRFTVFDKSNNSGILNNRFSSILADREGVLWAIAESGIVTVLRDGQFSSFPTPETWAGSVAVFSDQNGNALIESSQGYFYLEDGKFVRSEVSDDVNLKRRIYFGRSGARWYLTSIGATRLKDGDTTEYNFELNESDLGLGGNLRAFEDDRGALWFAVRGRLYRLSDGNVTVYSNREVPAVDELKLQQMMADASGDLWFIFAATPNTKSAEGRLVKFSDGEFTAHDLGKLSNATKGMIDREGNLWIASPTGLGRLREKVITTISVADGLNHNEVYPILLTKAGEILIGTVQGVNIYRDGKISDLGLNYKEGFPIYLRGMWEDPQSRIWLGFQGGSGFGRWEKPSGVSQIGTTELPNGATDFAADREGDVWVATEQGLFVYRDERLISHYTVADGFKNDKFVTLHFDREGTLWLGTFEGLSQLKNGQVVNFAGVENSPKGFVRVIYEDAEGVMWFGTYSDGLVRYKDGKFFDYQVSDGMFNNGVFSILEDDRGKFWMGSNRGIHRVSRRELMDYADGLIPRLNSVSYDEKDGMLNAECNGGRIPSAVMAADGKLWFPTMGGVAIVDPKAERANPNPPPVLIEKVTVDRQVREIPSLSGSIEIEPNQSNIAIEYTGLSLIKSDQIRFRYKLEGMQDNWIDVGTKRSVEFSYLPAGSYTFRMIAANSNGVWNDDGASLTIVVHPYFYQTWWFSLIAALALALLVVFVFRIRVARLRQISATKTEFSRRLIESQEAERKRIASELHDGLGQSLAVIKNRAVLGITKGEDRERVAKELTRISESAANALEEVREITNNLRPQLLDRLGLTKALNSLIKQFADVIEIESEIDVIDDIFDKNGEISIYRIVQESLNNVIKHSNASRVEVLIERGNAFVLIRIRDDGRGFDTENARPGGLGLVGIKERAEFLSGDFEVSSIIGEGTTVRIRIPVQDRNR